MLSTVHRPLVMKSKSVQYIDNRKKAIWKPECVIEYNQNMRLVDKSDSMIASLECARPTMKWYKKILFHLLDLGTLNAHILHREVTGIKESLADFAKQMCREILAEHATDKGTQSSANSSHLRLKACHFPSTLPNNSSGTRKLRRKCHVCLLPAVGQPKRSDTTFCCAECDKALCIDPCFRMYHTVKNACKCCK